MARQEGGIDVDTAMNPKWTLVGLPHDSERDCAIASSSPLEDLGSRSQILYSVHLPCRDNNILICIWVFRIC